MCVWHCKRFAVDQLTESGDVAGVPDGQMRLRASVQTTRREGHLSGGVHRWTPRRTSLAPVQSSRRSRLCSCNVCGRPGESTGGRAAAAASCRAATVLATAWARRVDWAQHGPAVCPSEACRHSEHLHHSCPIPVHSFLFIGHRRRIMFLYKSKGRQARAKWHPGQLAGRHRGGDNGAAICGEGGSGRRGR